MLASQKENVSFLKPNFLHIHKLIDFQKNFNEMMLFFLQTLHQFIELKFHIVFAFMVKKNHHACECISSCHFRFILKYHHSAYIVVYYIIYYILVRYRTHVKYGIFYLPTIIYIYIIYCVVYST